MTQINVSLVDHMGGDLSTVNAARVSFNKKKEKFDEQDERLIKYLGKHEHTSPFGHAFMSFRVKAPIFVARQLVKHKFLRWNEVSRRYVTDEPEFYEPSAWREAAKDKKQGSHTTNTVEYAVGDSWCGWPIKDAYKQVLIDVYELYKTLLEAGVAPEQARMVLPLSTMTEWVWSGSVDAFADMCKLRLNNDTQAETRLVAQGVDNYARELYPYTWTALVGPPW